jgi:hypothetical protein
MTLHQDGFAGRLPLSGQNPLSIDLYVEGLADHERELKASLDKDADLFASSAA